MCGEIMRYGLRNRFWIESILGSITGILAVVTIFWHDWIEAIFGADPDEGNGSAEWLVVLVFLMITVTCTAAAAIEWRKAWQAATAVAGS